MAQIPLNLRPEYEPDFSNFFVSDANQTAVNILKSPGRWTSPILLLLGPVGAGKTHLGLAWQKQAQGEFLDDAHSLDETRLFNSFNRALSGESKGLLLASQYSPLNWNIDLPDLKSRLAATPIINLVEHDEGSLEPILRSFFSHMGREVRADVVSYILKHSDRSVDFLREFVQELDIAAGEKKADLTKAFVAKYLKQRSELNLLSSPIE